MPWGKSRGEDINIAGKGGQSIIMMGATGAVGSEVVRALLANESLRKLTLLGRRPLEGLQDDRVEQHSIDIFSPGSYRDLLSGHDCAVCTLGVGQPSKMSKEDFLRIDKQAVLDFATECRAAGVKHFQLLSSIGAHPQSRSFYLRSKGELEDGLKALAFDRLSLFQPSMILTSTNRYGLSQAVTLAVWPVLSAVMFGPLRKFRGIPVSQLGKAMAVNALRVGTGIEVLSWADFDSLSG